MRHSSSYLFLAPAGLLLAAAAVYPLIDVIYLSLFRKLIVFGSSVFIGLDNYAFLFKDDRFRQALGNTVYFAVVSVAFELLIGLAAALTIENLSRGQGLIRALLLLPWTIPSVVSARMWEWMFNTDLGLLNRLLGTQIDWLGSPVVALHAAIMVDIWKTTPFIVLVLAAALQSIPGDLYRAAYVDGASNWVVLRRITLPLLLPAIAVAGTFRLLDAIRVFDSVYVLTGGGPAGSTETVSIYAYRILFQSLEFGYGSTVALSLFFMALLIGTAALPLLKERSA